MHVHAVTEYSRRGPSSGNRPYSCTAEPSRTGTTCRVARIRRRQTSVSIARERMDSRGHCGYTTALLVKRTWPPGHTDDRRPFLEFWSVLSVRGELEFEGPKRKAQSGKLRNPGVILIIGLSLHPRLQRGVAAQAIYDQNWELRSSACAQVVAATVVTEQR